MLKLHLLHARADENTIHPAKVYWNSYIFLIFTRDPQTTEEVHDTVSSPGVDPRETEWPPTDTATF